MYHLREEQTGLESCLDPHLSARYPHRSKTIQDPAFLQYLPSSLPSEVTHRALRQFAVSYTLLHFCTSEVGLKHAPVSLACSADQLSLESWNFHCEVGSCFVLLLHCWQIYLVSPLYPILYSICLATGHRYPMQTDRAAPLAWLGQDALLEMTDKTLYKHPLQSERYKINFTKFDRKNTG